MGHSRAVAALMGWLALAAACGDGGGGPGGWAVRFGGTGTDAPTAIAAMPGGGFAITGLFSDTASGGDVSVTAANAWDALVLVVDAAGEPAWAQPLGGTGNDLGHDLAVADDGSLVVVGSFSEKVTLGDTTVTSLGGTDGFVARLDADGTPAWLLGFGGVGEDLGRAVAIADDGDILIAGEFSGTAGFDDMLVQSDGESDAFYARLAPDGTPRWARRLGGRGFDGAHAIAAAPGGGFAIAGQFEGDMQVGAQSLSSKGFFDVFVAGLDAAGEPQWSHSFGDADADFAHAAASAADGTVAIAGEASGSIDFGGGAQATSDTDAYVATYAFTAGTPGWARLVAGPGFGSGQALALGDDGSVDIAGSFDDALTFDACTATSAGASDVAIAHFDPAGTCLWLQRFGGESNDAATAVTLASDATPVVAGTFEDTGNFAYAALASTGSRDIFILTLPR